MQDALSALLIFELQMQDFAEASDPDSRIRIGGTGLKAFSIQWKEYKNEISGNADRWSTGGTRPAEKNPYDVNEKMPA